jgi:hypothetical protein
MSHPLCEVAAGNPSRGISPTSPISLTSMLWLGLYVLKGVRFTVGGRHHVLCCLLSLFPNLTLFPQKLDLACCHWPPHRLSMLPRTLDLLLLDRRTGLSLPLSSLSVFYLLRVCVALGSFGRFLLDSEYIRIFSMAIF